MRAELRPTRLCAFKDRGADAHRAVAAAVDVMLAAGVNVVTMSYWGPPNTDRWAFWAPMQTATGAHDQ